MKNLKVLTAAGATMAIIAAGTAVFAQDDLDDLLNDLEGDKPAETARPAAAKPAEAATVAAAPAAGEAKAEAPAVEEAKPAEAAAPAADAPAAAEETAAAEKPAAEAPAAAEETVAAEKPAAEAPAAAGDEDAELIANIKATEEIRRQAYDNQAKSEILEARKAKDEMDWREMATCYSRALKLINDSPRMVRFRKECEQGVAEGLYRSALEEDRTGRREIAVKLMEKAVDMRHPKARRQLEYWIALKEEDKLKVDLSAISHRRNDEDYKEQRKADQQILKRSRQLLALRDLDGALEQCEIVLAAEPYNQEALRLRSQIIKKQKVIIDQEHETARDGWIADVGKKWRPVYAPNARKLGEVTTTTSKKPLGDDPERSVEQDVIKRMKEMRLPTLSFKPPATMYDAVEFFRGASKDYDRPDIPLEKRGFDFVLKAPSGAAPKAAAAEDDGFSATADDNAADAGISDDVKITSVIALNDISLYDGLSFVCDSAGYKFKVKGKVIMIMRKDMTTDEMVTRSYPVLASFIERMGSASSDIKEMKTAGFGGGNTQKDEGGEENQEKDWKAFFEMMGVQWPEGSTIMYIKTIGKLRVKNTYENLAELEKALTELNVDQKLIEIEARFVEVCQADLNSLGFEWILNSDYAIGPSALLGSLGLKEGTFTANKNNVSTTTTTGTQTIETRNAGGIITGTQVITSDSTTTTATGNTKSGGSWVSDPNGGGKVLGLNAFGGTDAKYGNGNRYLSTKSNHISGSEKSNNDQFMRLNAFLGTADLSMILHMLSQRSDTDLLSAPKVLTRPGEEAVIKVVTEYIYPTDYDVQLQSSGGSSGSYGGGGGSSMILAVVEPQSFTMREVGVILDVTPTLTDDGNLIDLKLNTQVVDEPTWKNYGMSIPFSGNSSMTSFAGIGEIFTGLSAVLTSLGANLSDSVKQDFAKTAVQSASNAMNNLATSSGRNIDYYEAPMQQPWFHVRSIDSSVSINPGSTIVMGGLITEERKAMDDKIPFLGDIPFIGRLFRSHSEWTNKRNLLIFVTTRLVDVRGREVALGQPDTVEGGDVKKAPEAEGN